jgi:hypothetical protein
LSVPAACTYEPTADVSPANTAAEAALLLTNLRRVTTAFGFLRVISFPFLRVIVVITVIIDICVVNSPGAMAPVAIWFGFFNRLLTTV